MASGVVESAHSGAFNEALTDAVDAGGIGIGQLTLGPSCARPAQAHLVGTVAAAVQSFQGGDASVARPAHGETVIANADRIPADGILDAVLAFGRCGAPRADH